MTRFWTPRQREQAQIILNEMARVCLDNGEGYHIAGQRQICRMTGFSKGVVTELMPLVVEMCTQQYPGSSVHIESDQFGGFTYRMPNRTTPGAKLMIVRRLRQMQVKRQRCRNELSVQNATATDLAAVSLLDSMGMNADLVERLLCEAPPPQAPTG